MAALHCYLVTYDIADPKRWRKVFKKMCSFGEHVQLSVFRCDLTPERFARLKIALSEVIHNREDQVLIVKLEPSTPQVIGGIEVLGRAREFRPPGPTIV